MTIGEASAKGASWSSFTELADPNYHAFTFDSALSAATGHVETVTMPAARGYRRLLCVSFN
jgi:hypothetical protein